LIAQLVLELVRELQQVQVQELALVLQPEQELVPQPERELVRELQQVQVQQLRLVRALVQHLPHQQLQSPFQLQRFRLLQREFLSIRLQLVKALQYQLCL
jgi:acyl transferase domain-containing protein